MNAPEAPKPNDAGVTPPSHEKNEAARDLRRLTFIAYFLGFLVLLVACAVAFRAYDLQRAKYVVLLIIAAAALAILPKVILLLPAVQSIEIGNVKLFMQKIEAEVKATKSETKEIAEAVGDIIADSSRQAGLIGGSKKRSRSNINRMDT